MARTRAFFTDELGLQATVIGAIAHGDGWRVTVEAIVEDEYMRQRARRDLIGTFEATLNEELAVTSFERKSVRERGTPMFSQ